MIVVNEKDEEIVRLRKQLEAAETAKAVALSTQQPAPSPGVPAASSDGQLDPNAAVFTPGSASGLNQTTNVASCTPAGLTSEGEKSKRATLVRRVPVSSWAVASNEPYAGVGHDPMINRLRMGVPDGVLAQPAASDSTTPPPAQVVQAPDSRAGETDSRVGAPTSAQEALLQTLVAAQREQTLRCS